MTQAPALRNSIFFISLFGALLAAIYLSDSTLLTLIIVLGQAHFFATYIYQGKAKKINQWYLLRFLGIAILLGGMTFYYYENSSYKNILTFFALFTFVYHYTKDELKLCTYENPSVSIEGKLRMGVVLILSVVYLPFLLNSFFHISSDDVTLLLFLTFPFIFLLMGYLLKKMSTNVREYVIPLTFIMMNIFALVGITLFSLKITVYAVAGFIILFHYIRWYLHYALKFTGDSWTFYMKTVLVCNIVSLLGFFLYLMNDSSGFLSIFYDPLFFYCWTLMHIFLTIRKDDFEMIKS